MFRTAEQEKLRKYKSQAHTPAVELHGSINNTTLDLLTDLAWAASIAMPQNGSTK